MLIIRILPTVDELVARAIADTRFVAEVTAPDPHDPQICAELAADQAAELWEAANDMPVGGTITSGTRAGVAMALAAHAIALRDASDNALYQAAAKIERSIAILATARKSTTGPLPLPAAEALMDDIEDHFDTIAVALKRALAIFETAIDRIEWAASRRRAEVA